MARGAHRRLAGARGAARRVVGRARRRGVRARRRGRAPARRAHRDHPPHGRPRRAGAAAPLRRRPGDPHDPRPAAGHGRLPLPRRRRPVHERPPPPHRRGRRRAPRGDARAGRALDQHEPPRRRADGEADPPSHRWSCSTRTQQPPCPTRLAPTRACAARTCSRRCWSSAGRTPATSPTSSCRPPCSPGTSTCTRPTATTTRRSTCRWPTAGEALPNAEYFRRIAAAMGLDHPRLRDSSEDLVRQLLDGTGTTYEELRETTYARLTGVKRGTAPFAEGGFPTAGGRARIVDPELARRGVERWWATRRRSRRPTRARRALPAGARGARGPVLHELDLRLAALAHRQAGSALVHLHPRRGGARPGRRQPGARANVRGAFLGGGEGRRRDPAGPRVHLQGLLGAAEPRPSRTSAP